MNEQYSGARFYTPPSDEKPEMDTNVPAAGWNALADNVPAEASVIDETPAGERIVHEAATAEALYTAPLSTALPDATPPLDTLVHEAATVEAPYTAPLNTALPYTAPVVDKIAHEAATVEAPYTAPLNAPLSDATPLVETPLVETPLDETIVHEAPIAVKAGLVALLSGEDAEHFRTRWNEIQGTFVDDPRTAVQHADVLVTEAVEKITQMFAGERSTLESKWKLNNDVSTEDLRKALQQYRSFFNRLVG